jgi:hypothetical protein
MQAPAVAPTDALQDPDEDRAVGIVQKDRRAAIPLRADVVVRAGLGVAKGSSHAANVPASRAKEPRVHLSTLLRHAEDTCQARDMAAGVRACLDSVKPGSA